MGVRHLDTFVRQNVPDGFFSVNIEDEIRKYFNTAAIANPPAPVIVVDLMTLNQPLSNYDKRGLLFGGRFNLAYSVIETFFAKLTDLGAQLVFFHDGPLQDSKTDTWCKRQDDRYDNTLTLFNGIERGADLDTLLREYPTPVNFRYPLKFVAKKYGQYRMVIARECDQELAAFAKQINALAILSDDSDFLIYEGSWKYWSSRELDLATLTTMEYNRSALVSHLKLSYIQMPLLATLSGNDIMPYQVVRRLHSQLGSIRDKFPNMACFIRRHYSAPLTKVKIVSILREITGHHKIQKDNLQRFQQSLDTYRVNISALNVNPNGDPVLAALIKEDSPFTYLIWQGKCLDVAIGLVDMRPTYFGSHFAKLHFSLILRMAGIILFHRKPLRPTHCAIIIKLNHHNPHRKQSYTVQYPQDIEPPTLPELQDKDPAIHEGHRDVKQQLLAWIASDTLQPDWLRSVPRVLQLTVYTLYYLVEQQALELFEADLLLQVAYDVAYETYDFHGVDYPRTLKLRPFQLIFIYQKVYSYTAKAFRLVGLDGDDFREDPPLDGVLFHKRYEDFRDGRCDLRQIRTWRIYEGTGREGRN
ncbi:constitutive coactivator of PPAR-gamma-like protein 1 homolog [Ochlerotatus camptorhynchus]|uniref:constitutive coactivator of PPAR-gamma-like protein 1 homolog n=1 Tax=Ochlerotatus camptorhynchus TaxID=644619 RepID=UPI0031CF670D